MAKRVLVPLAPEFQAVETIIVIDVLRRARIEVTLAGSSAGPVEGTHQTVVPAEIAFDAVDAAAFDMIVVPGGSGALCLQQDERVLGILRAMDAAEKLIAAICRGPVVLHAAGLLAGKRIACSPMHRGELSGTEIVDDRVVIDGRIITSPLPGTSMEFAIKLIELLRGEKHAEYVARTMLARV